MCFIILLYEHFFAILVTKMALSFDSPIKQYFFGDKERHFLEVYFIHISCYTYRLLYLISVLVFTIENDMSNLPWCSVLFPSEATGGHYFLINGNPGSMPNEPMSLQHLIPQTREIKCKFDVYYE